MINRVFQKSNCILLFQNLKINILAISVVAILLLMLLNLLWTIKLLHVSELADCAPINNSLLNQRSDRSSTYIDCSLQFNQIPYEKQNYDFSELAFSDLKLEFGRWDNQHLYKILDFALVGDSFKEASISSFVCLATQSSIERSYSLVQVAQQWNGPISVAIFIAGNEEFIILQYYVTYMRLCFEFIRNNVTFHIAFPHKQQPMYEKRKFSKGFMDNFDCTYPEHTLRHLLKLRTTKSIRWRMKNIYPQNHMRNIARKGCQSKFVFLTDIDIIPSRNIVPELNLFLGNVECESRCAYVIPTFEIDNRVQFPSSKTELLRLLKKGLARPFHEKVFIYNQFATNFSSWNSDTKSESRIYISHTVTNFEFLYEPFYVSLDNVPIHDERFIGYGFTRNTQVYEMYVAGYAFFVLTPVFTCHWGLQQKQSRPAWREQQNNINRKKFEIFKSEIFARYKNDPLKMISLRNKRRGR